MGAVVEDLSLMPVALRNIIHNIVNAQPYPAIVVLVQYLLALARVFVSEWVVVAPTPPPMLGRRLGVIRKIMGFELRVPNVG
jgi:hypothetical protein